MGRSLQELPINHRANTTPAPSHCETLLRRRPEAARVARRIAAEFAQDRVGTEVGADLAVVVSELVTNAIRHGEGDIRLRLSLSDGETLRVAVHDDRPAGRLGIPSQRKVETGRGLSIVERLSARWGVQPTEIGKTVWSELRC